MTIELICNTLKLTHKKFELYYKNNKFNGIFDGLDSLVHKYAIANLLSTSNHFEFEQVDSN